MDIYALGRLFSNHTYWIYIATCLRSLAMRCVKTPAFDNSWSVYIYLYLYNKCATIVNTRQRGLIRDSTLGVNTTGNRSQKIVIAVLRTHQETETEDPKIHGVRIYLLQFDHNEVFNVEQC